MKKKARDWKIRLTEEIRTDTKSAEFITLTFSNESIKELTDAIHKVEPELEGYALDNAIAILAQKKFSNRWKKKRGTRIKHWLVTELGHNGTENIHLHGIVWNDIKTEKREKQNHKIRAEFIRDIKETWKYGFVYIGDYVNEQTVNYITKYVLKIDEDHKEYKPTILASSGHGKTIGSGYLKRWDSTRNKYKEGNTNEAYSNRQGYQMGLPIYYRNKIYSEEEREKLWLEKLDKQERWVLGSKIDISKGEGIYYKVLEHARKLNARLGYGSDKKDWNREIYENARRTLMQQERTKEIRKSLEILYLDKETGEIFGNPTKKEINLYKLEIYEG